MCSQEECFHGKVFFAVFIAKCFEKSLHFNLQESLLNVICTYVTGCGIFLSYFFCCYRVNYTLERFVTFLSHINNSLSLNKRNQSHDAFRCFIFLGIFFIYLSIFFIYLFIYLFI